MTFEIDRQPVAQRSWVKAFSDETSPVGPDQDLLRENERLRRENRILREEREVLKKATVFFAGQKP